MKPTPRLQVRSPSRLPWPRRTARLRFTAVYGGLFLLFGVALVATTYFLFQHATEYINPRLPNIPSVPAAIKPLQLPSPQAPTRNAVVQLPQALVYLGQDQNQLAQDQHQLELLGHPVGVTVGPLKYSVPQLAQDQQQLAQDQHQLAAAVNQLAGAVHQVAEAGTVQAAQRASDSHQLLVNSGIALAIVAVLALLAGWLVAGRVLRPIRIITATARRISASNLRERLSMDRADEEFKRLGDTLDDLFGRLDAAFEAQRHFVANASHELRTPITAERNLLQVALDDTHTSTEVWRSTAEELLASNDEQKHLIEALLILASSESGLDHREPIDLAGICQTVLARSDSHTDGLGLSVKAAIGAAPLDGDPRLIERLVANLVDNAIGHNVASGQVRISTETTDGQAMLTVANTGPVVPAEEIDRLFQPFQRLDPRRAHHKNGHGLGLSIVQAIATTHHATVTAHPLPEGGLTVTVAFPPPASPIARPDRSTRTWELATSHP